MATLYPLNIDNNTSLPQLVNLVSPVDAASVNNLRQAILAIETELGVEPSGTYGTVRARLDAIEAGGGGGGGGGGSITVSKDYVSIVSPTTNVNFIGNVNVTNSGSGIATVEILGGGEAVQQSSLATSGQTVFTLSQTPSDNDTVMMFINGNKQRYGTDYTASGTTVTYTGSLSLITTDVVEFWYLITGGGGGGGGSITVSDEGTAVVSSATNLNFVGSGVTVTDGGGGTATITISGGGNPSVGVIGTLNVSNGSGAWNSTNWSGTGSTLSTSGAAVLSSSSNTMSLSGQTGVNISSAGGNVSLTSSTGTVTTTSATSTTLNATTTYTVSAGSNILISNTAGSATLSGYSVLNLSSATGNVALSGSNISSSVSSGNITQTSTSGNITSTAGGQISLLATGNLNLKGGSSTFVWPSTDGTSADAMLTNGSGGLYFGSVVSAGDSVPPTLLYVNGTTGNDSNSGSIGSPLQTINKALQKVGPTVRSECVIYITGPSNLANGYSCTELDKERFYNANLIIYADSWTQTAGPFTSTGYSGTTISASAAGLTTDQYVGQIVEITASTDSSLVGLKRTIARVTAPGNLELMAPFPSSVPNGSTFRIIKSNVILDLNSVNIGVGPEYRIVRVRAPMLMSFSYFNNHSLLLRGLTFSSSDFTNSVEFSGNIYMYACGVNDNVTNSYFTEVTGEIGVNTFSYYTQPYLTVDQLNGLSYVHALISGSTISTTSASAVGSNVYFRRCKVDKLSIVTGQCYFDENTFCHIDSCRIIGYDYSFTSGALFHRGASTIWYGFIAGNPKYISTPSTTTQLVIEESSHVQFITGNFQVLSGTGKWLLRDAGLMTFSNYQPTVLGQIECVGGGRLRLVNVTGSSIAGGFSCGYGTPATALTFANAGDAISSLTDTSAVFRSS